MRKLLSFSTDDPSALVPKALVRLVALILKGCGVMTGLPLMKADVVLLNTLDQQAEAGKPGVVGPLWELVERRLAQLPAQPKAFQKMWLFGVLRGCDDFMDALEKGFPDGRFLDDLVDSYDWLEEAMAGQEPENDPFCTPFESVLGSAFEKKVNKSPQTVLVEALKDRIESLLEGGFPDDPVVTSPLPKTPVRIHPLKAQTGLTPKQIERLQALSNALSPQRSPNIVQLASPQKPPRQAPPPPPPPAFSSSLPPSTPVASGGISAEEREGLRLVTALIPAYRTLNKVRDDLDRQRPTLANPSLLVQSAVEIIKIKSALDRVVALNIPGADTKSLQDELVKAKNEWCSGVDRAVFGSLSDLEKGFSKGDLGVLTHRVVDLYKIQEFWKVFVRVQNLFRDKVEADFELRIRRVLTVWEETLLAYGDPVSGQENLQQKQRLLKQTGQVLAVLNTCFPMEFEAVKERVQALKGAVQHRMEADFETASQQLISRFPLANSEPQQTLVLLSDACVQTFVESQGSVSPQNDRAVEAFWLMLQFKQGPLKTLYESFQDAHKPSAKQCESFFQNFDEQVNTLRQFAGFRKFSRVVCDISFPPTLPFYFLFLPKSEWAWFFQNLTDATFALDCALFDAPDDVGLQQARAKLLKWAIALYPAALASEARSSGPVASEGDVHQAAVGFKREVGNALQDGHSGAALVATPAPARMDAQALLLSIQTGMTLRRAPQRRPDVEVDLPASCLAGFTQKALNFLMQDGSEDSSMLFPTLQFLERYCQKKRRAGKPLSYQQIAPKGAPLTQEDVNRLMTWMIEKGWVSKPASRHALFYTSHVLRFNEAALIAQFPSFEVYIPAICKALAEGYMYKKLELPTQAIEAGSST